MSKAVEIDWTEEVMEEDYEELLNDNYEDIEICGMVMSQGTILKICDYTAFRESYNNWIDSEAIEQGNFKCSVCDTIYQEEEEAEECCN